MEDAQLVELAQLLIRWQAKEKLAEGKVKKLKRRIQTELERRDTTGLVSGGVRFTYVAPKETVYHLDQLEAVIDPELFAAITKPQLDKEALAEMISNNEFDLETLASCSEEIAKTPYALVKPIAPKE